MTRHSHAIIGGVAAYVLGLPVVPAVVGSLMPDIDLAWSKREPDRNRRNLFNSHRGITHHILLGFGIFMIAVILDSKDSLSFAVGYFSHIVADMLTKYGIPYWTMKDRISLGLFKTASAGEFAFLLMFIMFFWVYVLKHGVVIPEDWAFLRSILR